MNTKRTLVIEKLVINIPDELQAKDGRDEITIDEALEWYLQYRKTQQAALENKLGNFFYFFANLPDGAIPDLPTTMKSENFMQYLSTKSNECSAGMMATLIYDPELGAYRNCYTEDEMRIYAKKKGNLDVIRDRTEKRNEKASPSDLNKSADCEPSEKCPRNHCFDCDYICDEYCPMTDHNRGEGV